MANQKQELRNTCKKYDSHLLNLVTVYHQVNKVILFMLMGLLVCVEQNGTKQWRVKTMVD